MNTIKPTERVCALAALTDDEVTALSRKARRAAECVTHRAALKRGVRLCRITGTATAMPLYALRGATGCVPYDDGTGPRASLHLHEAARVLVEGCASSMRDGAIQSSHQEAHEPEAGDDERQYAESP